MQGCRGMRHRFVARDRFRGYGTGPTALAGGFVLPAASFSDFVDNHVGILVPVVLVAIIVLLGSVMLAQRRAARQKPQLESIPNPTQGEADSAKAPSAPDAEQKPAEE